MSPDRKSRRKFLEEAGYSLAGIAALVGAADLAGLSPDSDKENVLAAVRRRPFVTQPTEAVDAFLSASRGILMLYYQLFFPMYISGNEVEKVMEIEELCQRRLKLEQSGRNVTRLRTLPAVAAAHALLSADKQEADALREIILKTSHRSLELDEEPNREVLEVIWRAMNAVLIRTPRHWRDFEAGQALVNSAESICVRFLSDTQETLPLLNPAASAWQFLIAYQRALGGRSAPADSPVVNAAISKIQSVPSPRNAWLHGLTKLYTRRFRYDDMLPQSFEIMIGRLGKNLKKDDREAADFFVLLGLQMWHNIYLIASGQSVSPYMIDIKRAQELLKDVLTFYGNYGVRQSDWNVLKSTHAGNLLSTETISHLNEVFDRYEDNFNCDRFQGRERTAASWLANLVPFRQVEEHNVASRTYDLRALILAFVGTGKSEDKRLSCWLKPAAQSLYERSGQIEMKSANVLLESALKQHLPLNEPAHVAYFGELDEAFSSEHVQKTIITFPARTGPAGAGVVQTPVKRSPMTTQFGEGPALTQHQALKKASRFMLFNYGERLAVGVPELKTISGFSVWVAPIHFRVKAKSTSQIGKITVDAQTGEIVEVPTKEELLDHVRAIAPA